MDASHFPQFGLRTALFLMAIVAISLAISVTIPLGASVLASLAIGMVVASVSLVPWTWRRFNPRWLGVVTLGTGMLVAALAVLTAWRLTVKLTLPGAVSAIGATDGRFHITVGSEYATGAGTAGRFHIFRQSKATSRGIKCEAFLHPSLKSVNPRITFLRRVHIFFAKLRGQFRPHVYTNGTDYRMPIWWVVATIGAYATWQTWRCLWQTQAMSG